VVPGLFILGGVALLKVLGGVKEPTAIGINIGQYNSPLPLPYTAVKANSSCFSGSRAIPGGYTVNVEDVAATGAAKADAVFGCENIDGSFHFNNNYMGELYACTAETAAMVMTTSESNKAVSEKIGNEYQATCNASKTTQLGPGLSTSESLLQMANYVYENGVENYLTPESRYGSFDFVTNDCSPGKKVDLVIGINSTGFHAPAVFLNLASQIIAGSIKGGGAITSTYHPFSLTEVQKTNNGNIGFTIVALFLIIAFSVVPATFISFVVMETRTKAKHLQTVSGVSVLAYWTSTMIFDFLCYSVPMLAAWAILAGFSIDGLIGANFPATALVFILFGFAIANMTYIYSFVFDNEGKALIFCVMVYFFTGFLFYLVDFLLAIIDSTKDIESYLKYAFALFPEFAFARALSDINANHAKLDCSEQFKAGLSTTEVETYCHASIFAWHVAGTWILFLAVEAVVFFLLVLFIDYSKSSGGVFKLLFHRSPVVVDDPYELDEDLLREEERVNSGAADSDMVVVQDLRKVYPGRGNVGAKVAVKKMTFGVPAGEVFGFLGINGAGKTTTLSILSGEFPATSGAAKLAGLDMLTQRQAINQKMGYCPQFDAVLARLTGREHLEMFARIKGISEEEIPAVVDDCINKMNLREHCEREAGGYSGGNKRKLSVAMALVGNPQIVFLDEPSTGMDPEARRFMWDVIASTMAGRSVILTTHSMEEAEALSNRIGIMVGGRLRCIGSTQHLKNKYGAGYTLEMRVKEVHAAAADEFVMKAFPGAVVSERYGGQLRYDIKRSDLKLSEMFAKLEAEREALSIEDYALSQTTLEKVFLQFAAEQEEETGAAPGMVQAASSS